MTQNIVDLKQVREVTDEMFDNSLIAAQVYCYREEDNVSFELGAVDKNDMMITEIRFLATMKVLIVESAPVIKLDGKWQHEVRGLNTGYVEHWYRLDNARSWRFTFAAEDLEKDDD